MTEQSAVRNFTAGRHSLQRDAHGRLILRDAETDGEHIVVPVRAFPIDAPDEGISLVGADGHEMAWVDQISALDPVSAELVAQELALRDFVPCIEQIESVSTFATPSTWTVSTDRGRAMFVLKGEEDIRRLRDRSLLITDSHGVTYRIRDMGALDRNSRRLLDRFL